MPDAPTPRWLSYDAQSQILDLQIGTQSLFEILDNGINTVQEGVKKIDDANVIAQRAFDDLAKWYKDVSKDKEVPLLSVIDALDKLLIDAYRMGIYVYATVPDYGGYDYLKYDLARSFTNQNDPHRPIFSENSSMGGIVLLISGTITEIFMVTMLISYLRGAPPSFGEMLDRIADRIFAYRHFLEAAEGALMDSADDINKHAREVVETFQKGSLGKMAKDFMAWKDREFDTETVSMKYLDVKFLNEKLPAEAKDDATFYLYEQQTSEPVLKWDAYMSPLTGWISADNPKGGKTVIDALSKTKTDKKTGKAVVLKRFIIELAPAVDPLSVLDRAVMIDFEHPENLFGNWQQVFRPSGLIPGATRFVDTVSGALETAGATISEVKKDVDNLVETAIGETAATVDSIMNRARVLGDDVVGQLRSVVYDLTNLLKASVLYVPPQSGGSHQFQYALEQYLSNEAPGAPFMGDGDFVAAIVLAAAVPVDVNDPAATPVVQALKDAANMFPGIDI